MKRILIVSFLLITCLLIWQCKTSHKVKNNDSTQLVMNEKLAQFVTFKLTTNLSVLSEKEKQILSILFESAQIMDEIYWTETFGEKSKIIDTTKNEALRKLIQINYGPWERLNSNKSFVAGVGEKPLGANFYPIDMTKKEFDSWAVKEKNSPYTLIRRDSAKKLIVIPYHIAFAEQVKKASDLLLKASTLSEDKGLKNYLALRALALLTDDYYNSDLAWMDMKSNNIDFVVGPIENYEDALFGLKASHEAFILIKDKEWTSRLAKYTSLLPALQTTLPVESVYKKEKPGSNSDLGAYDVVYYAGDANAGGKTIAINLPNDERVQAAKGSRRLQLKNSMKAKFDNILLPISSVLIDSTQRSHIKFESFFENTMFHEIAHGLGIKQTITKKGTVRAALKDKFSGLEEEKADILGLFMIKKLNEMSEIKVDLRDNYTTFVAGIIRSVRFGGADAHGQANLATFNFFKEKGAFTRSADGIYSVDYEKTQAAVESLSSIILKLQGDGDYDGVVKFMYEKGTMDASLKEDLKNLLKKNIPVDIIFEQGPQVLGLK
jgi:hypothetical protein